MLTCFYYSTFHFGIGKSFVLCKNDGMKSKEIVIILNDIRSAHNVGAMFRTAEAAGVSKIYLTGYSPAPLDRFGRERTDIAKAALGAEKLLAWEQAQDTEKLLKNLKQDGFDIVAVEQAGNSVNYRDYKVGEKTALVFGNEVDGVSESILKQSDSIIEIPMKGKKESLNVSTSAGVVLFRLSE